MKKPILLIASLGLLLSACSAAPANAVCDNAQFVDHVILDVPVQQGATVMPGTLFTKTWQVLNNGQCEWTGDYALVQSGGEAMSAIEEVALPGVVASGETVDISVPMTAPSIAGSYTSEWMLRNAEGKLFGVGPEGERPLTVELVVPELPEGVVYDFNQVICLAQWHSNRAQFLSCEGVDDEEGLLDGYVRLNTDPALEGSTRGNPPVIEMKPNNQQGGWLAGFFPPITIQEGYHFLATVGCMDGEPDCSVLFRLDYELEDGTHATLIESPQVFDDIPGEIDVDLSSLAGQNVTLVLVVLENGGASREARGYWMDARLEGTAVSESTELETTPTVY
ncbi:MAG: NBR1-Ig-like domain-containing protein [Chloroflexi bacterium]|nr:NBR1-Ig-like domain-containing protein [Chloroflexota bacterium]